MEGEEEGAPQQEWQQPEVAEAAPEDQQQNEPAEAAQEQ